MRALGRVGEALRAVGRSAQAIEAYAGSLSLAEAAGDLEAQAAALSYLARCHYNQGRCDEALALCRRAFVVVGSLAPGAERDRRTRYLNGVTGLCRLFTGDVAGAIGPLGAAVGPAAAGAAEALEADRHVGYLGLCYAYLGRHDEAVAHFERALAMAKSVGHRYGEAMHLVNLGEVLNARGEPERALELARKAVAIGDEIRSPRISGWGRWCIALALAGGGHFHDARAELVGSTAQYSDPMNDDSLDMLLGVLCLRLQDGAAATDCFRRAIAGATTMLARNPRYFFSLDAAGVAWTGLALLGEAAARQRAVDAFRRARAVTRAAGHVDHVARLLGWLVPGSRPRWYARIAAAAGA
jgi:tetratricopeptide (TPR) repeat protein